MGKVESVIPVKSILIGATQAEEEDSTEVKISGRLKGESPTIIPKGMDSVRGFKSFLATFPFPVSIA